MNYIYVDNYRGFSDTAIPILNVNFLVGENSTGKTSILGLIKLLSPPDFWLKNEFDFRKVGLGTFKDIVSVNASDKSYFSVGMVFDENTIAPKLEKSNGVSGKKENSVISIIIMTFVEHEGIPKLASILSYRKGFEISVKYVGKKIKYKYRKHFIKGSSEEFIGGGFKEWLVGHRSDSSGYTILKEAAPFLRAAPPIIIISLIEEIIQSGKPAVDRISYEITSFFNDIAWLAPIRSKPKKTYDEFSLEYSPEGAHTPYLIKKKLDSKQDSEKFKRFLIGVGEQSGLFKRIEIKSYGRGATTPFELEVILSEHPLSVSSVGYGVSQALPVIVEMFSRPRRSWFAIQQPEVHLHPKAQAAFGEIVFNLCIKEEKNFIIETHSDYTIDRFRILLRKSKSKPKSQILFFERGDFGNVISAIPISSNGEISSDQPDSYREFFLREEMELLGLI